MPTSTDATAHAVRRILIGVGTTILAIILLGAWNAKVDRAEFELHVQQETATREAILDLLCADHPAHRRCR